MSQTKRSLWMRFATIAQPFFFPNIRGGGLVTLLLLTLLLVFLFGVLFMIVGGITLVGNHFAPSLTAEIASGLLAAITQILLHNDVQLPPCRLALPRPVPAIFRRQD